MHLACKRDHLDIIVLLLKYGCRIDAQDNSGRTPLHVAAFYNNLEKVKILLYELANPLKKTNSNELAIDLTTNMLIKFYLERAKNLHILNTFYNPKLAFKRIKNGFQYFIDVGDNTILNELIIKNEI